MLRRGRYSAKRCAGARSGRLGSPLECSVSLRAYMLSIPAQTFEEKFTESSLWPRCPPRPREGRGSAISLSGELEGRYHRERPPLRRGAARRGHARPERTARVHGHVVYVQAPAQYAGVAKGYSGGG